VASLSFPLRFQPICNCFSLIFLKITPSVLAREQTTVSGRFILILIAVELSPVSTNLRSLSSSACVHGREAKSAGSVIGAPLVSPGKQQANTRKPPVRIWQLSNSTGAGNGVTGFRLIDGDGVFVCQMDGAARHHDPERNG
jgi:hypothetical protein